MFKLVLLKRRPNLKSILNRPFFVPPNYQHPNYPILETKRTEITKTYSTRKGDGKHSFAR